MRYFLMGILFLLATVLHWGWTSFFSIKGLAPQVLLVLTVVAASRRGPIAAMCFGFAWGLFLDVFAPHIFGANALLLTLVGYAVGAARRQIDVNGLAPQCVLVLGMTWAYFLCHGLLGLLFVKHFLWVGWRPFIFDPFYNCLLIPFLFVIWDRMIEA